MLHVNFWVLNYERLLFKFFKLEHAVFISVTKILPELRKAANCDRARLDEALMLQTMKGCFRLGSSELRISPRFVGFAGRRVGYERSFV
jgi:hypothetical protein